MDSIAKERLRPQIMSIIAGMQDMPGEWVNLADLGGPLHQAGIDYRSMGYEKLRYLLMEYRDDLDFDIRQIPWDSHKPPVRYTRPKVTKSMMDAAIKPAYMQDAPDGATKTEYMQAVPDAATKYVNAQNVPEAATMSENAEEMPDTDIRPVNTQVSSDTEGTPNVAISQRNPRQPIKGSTALDDWSAAIAMDKLKELAELALPEQWYFENRDSTGELPILVNYLRYTFWRLTYEGKIQYSLGDGLYAAFNTGLVDGGYEDIYALFKKNSHPTLQYWFLIGFGVPGTGDIGRTLTREFAHPFVARADYFSAKQDKFIYDTTAGLPEYDKEHIIKERLQRFPYAFIKDKCKDLPDDLMDRLMPMYFLTEPGITKVMRREYFLKLGDAAFADAKIRQRITECLDRAVLRAFKKLQWNYKTAIPMYYSRYNDVTLLIPLALEDDDTVDMTMAVSRERSGSYQGRTVLTLRQAYMDGRVIARPDSEWLNTKMKLPDDGSYADTTDEA